VTDQIGVGAFSQATGRGPEAESGQYQQRYRAYQFDLIARHCGPSVLEVGAGLGDFASQFTGLERLIVTDVDPECVEHLSRRFADRPEVEARQLDLGGGCFDVGAPVSTVVAVNVLEHMQHDSATLRNLARLVEPGGNIVLWVPGYMQLYGDFDRRVGHVRRYTPTTLRTTIVEAGWLAPEVRPVNLLGGVAWWLAVRRGGVGTPRPAMVRGYDRVVVPITRALESRVTPPFGQSVLAVATSPTS
jgi:SAM-dependent methyltransferase